MYLNKNINMTRKNPVNMIRLLELLDFVNLRRLSDDL